MALEARRRQLDLRLVNLPEGAGGRRSRLHLSGELATRGSKSDTAMRKCLDAGESPPDQSDEYIKRCGTKNSYHGIPHLQG